MNNEKLARLIRNLESLTQRYDYPELPEYALNGIKESIVLAKEIVAETSDDYQKSKNKGENKCQILT